MSRGDITVREALQLARVFGYRLFPAGSPELTEVHEGLSTSWIWRQDWTLTATPRWKYVAVLHG